jgi:ribosomal protein S18 acetylase RimI-like enzyme
MSNEDSESKISLFRKKVRNLFTEIQEGFSSLYTDNEDYITLRISVSKAQQIAETKLKHYINTHKINVEIREAEAKDISKINEIYHSSWKASDLPMKEVTEELLMEIFEDSDTHFLIARLDSKDVGFILIEFNKLNREIGLISGLGVLPKYQQGGIGKYLALEAWKFFENKGVKELRCEVYKNNEMAKRFIIELGFEERTKAPEAYGFK